jgi:hypothetical protein
MSNENTNTEVVIQRDPATPEFRVAHAGETPVPAPVQLSREESDELYDIMMEYEFKGG